MRTSVLLSIKPCFAEAILGGTKTFELRRSLFQSEHVRRVLLYASRPVAKVIGEFTIGRVLALDLDSLWEHTCHGSAVSRSYFDAYFRGRQYGYAIEVEAVRRYREPLALAEFAVRRAPQSFQYVG